MNCTPSVRLEESAKVKDTDSVYAREGTLAHELAELELRSSLELINAETYDFRLQEIQANELYSEDMAEQVEKYTTYVLDQYEAAKNRNSDAIILIEEKTDLTNIIEEGYGTLDDVIIADKILAVTDLKYGKGIRVDATENPQ